MSHSHSSSLGVAVAVALAGVIVAGAAGQWPPKSRRFDLAEAIQLGDVEAVRAAIDSGIDANRPIALRPRLDRPLWFAIRTGDPGLVDALLEAGVTVRGNDAGVTPLHVAAQLGRAEIAAHLIRADAFVDAEYFGVSMQTPLFLAIAGGHTDTVRVLLEAGANVNRPTHDGRRGLMSPLATARRFGNPQVMAVLLHAGAVDDVTRPHAATTLLDAARSGDADLVRTFLDSGADVDCCDAGWQTVMHSAILSGSPASVRLLLEAGAPVAPNTDDEWTVLMSAARRPAMSVILEPLIAAGALVNAQAMEFRPFGGGRDDYEYEPGHTALMSAVLGGSLENARILLDAGADVTLASRKDNVIGSAITALHYAVETGNADMIRLLCERGAPLDDSARLLHWAASSGAEPFTALLDAGADSRADDGEGRSALWLVAGVDGDDVEDLVLALIERGATVDPDDPMLLIRATRQGSARTIPVLASAGAMVDGRDDSGVTALMHAAAAGSAEKVGALLEAGGAIDARDSRGATAFMYASEEGKLATMKQLVDAGASPVARDARGRSAMHYAARSPDPGRFMPSVVEFGLELDDRDASGATPLIVIAEEPMIRNIRGVIHGTPDIDARDEQGTTALVRAVAAGRHMQAARLMAARADVNAVTASGDTALCRMSLSQAGRGIAVALIAAGADPDRPGAEGCTPLIWAVRRRNRDAMLGLVDGGAGLDTTDRKGRTALMWAAEAGWLEGVRWLVERGADVSVRDADGRPALDRVRALPESTPHREAIIAALREARP